MQKQEQFNIFWNRDLDWREISATLDHWTEIAQDSRSPFPILSVTPIEIILRHKSLVTCELAALLGKIMFSLPHPEKRLVRSLPALFHLLNPVFTWGTVSSAVLLDSYPRIILEKDQPTGLFAEPSFLHGREFLRSQRIGWNPECQLYGADTDRWIGPDHLRSVSAYALDIALHVWGCLRQLETLWQQRGEKQECPHCHMIDNTFQEIVDQGDIKTPLTSLKSLLSKKAFTYYGLDPLLKAAQLYPLWLQREVSATYHSHPSLPNPPTA